MGTCNLSVQVVYTAGVRHGDKSDWQWCWDRYNTTNVPSERSILLDALASTTHAYTLQL